MSATERVGPVTAAIRRLDRYTVEVNGKRVRATPEQETRIRAMTPAELERFLTIMGADR